jgi:FkbM family methyltransferase
MSYKAVFNWTFQKIKSRVLNHKRIHKYGKVFKSKDDIYNYETSIIIKRVLKNDSNAIDIGSHKGRFLNEFLKSAPNGNHFAFEPLPYLFDKLTKKFPNNCKIYELALSDKKGSVTFNYVRGYPGYSGLKQRKYPLPETRIDKIKVNTDLLDNIIPKDTKIDFIKIDVEGAEYLIFQGSLKTIKKWKPVIIFEFGLGAADYYGITAEKMYALLRVKCKLHISTMEGYLLKKKSLDLKTFVRSFNRNIDYYFIAYK